MGAGRSRFTTDGFVGGVSATFSSAFCSAGFGGGEDERPNEEVKLSVACTMGDLPDALGGMQTSRVGATRQERRQRRRFFHTHEADTCAKFSVTNRYAPWRPYRTR